MTHFDGKCISNCQFCPQARESQTNPDMLSRIRWPAFPLVDLIKKLKSMGEKLPFRRICIQTINFPDLFSELISLIKQIKTCTNIPISVACHPLSKEEMIKLYEAGVERLGIPLDASTPALFSKIKGKEAKCPYKWETHLRAISQAREIFGSHPSFRFFQWFTTLFYIRQLSFRQPYCCSCVRRDLYFHDHLLFSRAPT